MSANGKSSTSEPAPRLCHVIKVDTFDGYGFNLHAEQGKLGQYIGKVDKGSPAETAGLKEGDKILEVNGVSIATDNHKQVVQKIKSMPNETKLLVVTPGPGEKVPGLNATNGTTKKEDISNKNEAKTIVEDKTKNGVDDNINILKNNENETTNNNDKSAPLPTEQMNKLNLTGMTVAEMREKLAQRKKVDPKKSQMDLKQKFEIVKKL